MKIEDDVDRESVGCEFFVFLFLFLITHSRYKELLEMLLEEFCGVPFSLKSWTGSRSPLFLEY